MAEPADHLGLSLPRLFVATDGRGPIVAPAAKHGLLVRDLDLATLLGVAEAADVTAGGPLLAVDLDSVEGLNPDAAGVRFVVRRLGIQVVVSRRLAAAARATELGALGMLRIFAFDSTGLARSLEGQPPHAQIGSVVSPGPVVGHISADDLARLPRPVVAYGLIASPELALALLRRVEAVVLSPECAAELPASLERAAG